MIIIPQVPKTHEPSIGFLYGLFVIGRIGASCCNTMIWDNNNIKKPKKRYTKHQIFFLRPPFCCQNAPKKACFFCQY